MNFHLLVLFFFPYGKNETSNKPGMVVHLPIHQYPFYSFQSWQDMHRNQYYGYHHIQQAFLPYSFQMCIRDRLGPIQHEKYDYLNLKRSDTYGLLVPKNCALAEKGTVTRDDLKNLPLIFPDQPYYGHQQLDLSLIHI